MAHLKKKHLELLLAIPGVVIKFMDPRKDLKSRNGGQSDNEIVERTSSRV